MGIVCQLYFSNSPTVFYLLGGKGNNLSRKLKLGRRIERCWVVLTWVLGKAVGPWEKWQAHNFFRAFLFVFIFVFVFGSSDRPTISFASFVFVFILVFVFGSSDRPTTSFALFCIYIMALVYFQICQQCQNMWLGMNEQTEEVMNIFFLATYWDVSVGCFVHFFVCQNSICFHWN